MPTHPPILQLHLIEHALALAIHLTARRQPIGNQVGTAISAPLNVLQRSLCPALTSAALFNMPWIDLDSCSRTGDLDLLQFMVTDYVRSYTRIGRERERDGPTSQTGPMNRGVYEGRKYKWRPLQWSSDALKFAASRGHLHVLEWWRTQQRVLATLEWPLVAASAAKSGRLDVLEWWDMNRSADAQLPLLYIGGDVVFSVHVLKWWLDPARGQQIAEEDVEMFLKLAAQAGSVESLQWMRDHGYTLDFSLIVRGANEHGQIHVLDWVLATVPTREEMTSACASYIDSFSYLPLAESACTSPYLAHWTVNQQLVIDWWISRAPWALFADPLEAKRVALFCARSGYAPQVFKSLDIQMVNPSKDLLITACESGDLQLVTALYERGCWDSLEPLCGCRLSHHCPTSGWLSASKSGNKDLLEWLLATDQDVLTEVLINACVARCEDRQGVDCLQWWKVQTSGDCSVFEAGYKRMGLDLCLACQDGNIAFIKFWVEALGKRAVGEFIDISCAHVASQMGQLGVLDILYSAAPSPFHLGAALCTSIASACDRIEVLDWWKRHGLITSECMLDGIDAASADGHVRILDWWLHESGLQLQFTEAAMDNASKHGHLDVLEWWYSASLMHGIQLKYSPAALSTSTEVNDGLVGPRRMQTLRWWSLRGFQFPQGVARYGLAPWPSTVEDQECSVFIMGNALELELLLQLGVQLGPKDPSILDHATCKGHVSVLQFLQSYLTVLNTDSLLAAVSFESINRASTRGETAAVEWWTRAGYFDQFEKEMQLALQLNKDGAFDDEDL